MKKLTMYQNVVLWNMYTKNLHLLKESHSCSLINNKNILIQKVNNATFNFFLENELIVESSEQVYVITQKAIDLIKS